MPWQVAIGFSIVLNSITNLIQRSYSQRSSIPHTFPPAISYSLGVMPVGLFAAFVIFPHHIAWSWWLGLLLLIEGVSMAIATWLGFKAASKLAVAPFQTITRFYEVVVVLLGWTLLSEKLSFYQAVGAAVLLIAAFLAIWAPFKNINSSRQKPHFDSAMITLLAATALGISLVTEKALLGHMNIGGVFLVGWSTQTVAMVILASKDVGIKNIKALKHYELKWSVLMGLANGLSGVFYVYSIFHSNNISLITALTAVVLPLTVLGAYLILHERDKQELVWLSVVVCFVGLLISAL